VKEGHVEVIPDLDGLIPRGSDAESGLASVVETDDGNGISMLVLVDGELALRAGVPDLDVSIEGSSDDLSVISGKSDGKDVSLVTDELGDGAAGLDIPETDGTVPRGGESETGVTGKLDLRDEMGVTSHHFLGLTPVLTVLILFTLGLKSPLDESLITGAGKKEFLALTLSVLLLTDSEGSDPTAVTSEEASVLQTVLRFVFFDHCSCCFGMFKIIRCVLLNDLY